MSAPDRQGVTTQVGGPPAPPSQAPGVRAPTCGLEDPGIAQAVSLGKGFHHPVDLLGLSGEAEAPEKLPGLERNRCGRERPGWMPGVAEPPPRPRSLRQEPASNSLVASAAVSGMAPS